MATYVERDGDWVLRPPGRLEHVTMHLFLLRAGAAELSALCHAFINAPSGGAVTATPLFPNHPFVLLTCADIAKGYSQDVDDAGHGWMPERDVGIFVPVTLTAGGTSRVGNLLPYLYVDNFAAVLIGREIFGFPKVLADIAFGSVPWSCTVRAPVSVTSNPAQPAGPATILGVQQLSPLPGVPIPGLLDDALALILDAAHAALGVPGTPGGPFATIPMAFLKQFRDAVVRTAACHQSIVLAEAGITGFHGGELWTSLPLLKPFAITIPPYHSVDMGTRLGLGSGPTYYPVLSLRITIDFALGFGTTLWTAP